MVINKGKNFFLLKKLLTIAFWVVSPTEKGNVFVQLYHTITRSFRKVPTSQFSVKSFLFTLFERCRKIVLLLNSLKHSHGNMNEIKTTVHIMKRLGKGKILEISQKLQNKTVKLSDYNI